MSIVRIVYTIISNGNCAKISHTNLCDKWHTYENSLDPDLIRLLLKEQFDQVLH